MDGLQQVTGFRITGLALALWSGLILAGCGTPAAPLAPSLNLPVAVQNLSAIRTGNAVTLSWTMPTRTTDKVVMRNPIDVQLMRAEEAGPFGVIADRKLPPGASGTYSDELTAGLDAGPDRRLRYAVEVRNHAGKSAGISNVVSSAAGASPPALSGLTAQVRAEGVLLSWQAVPEPGRAITYRIERVDTSPDVAEARPTSPLAPATPAATQTLAVHASDGADPGHAYDTSARYNRQYRYLVDRVATPAFPAGAVEVRGTPSEAIVVTTTDRFPPGVPQGLAAVADAAEAAIDLSWTPDTESDLAAYHVYRRDTQGDGPARPIASLHTETSYRDTSIQPGHTYAYSISATDESNNESDHSPVVEETLPPR